MTYKYSQGRRKFGDIEYEGDTNTEIDFEDDYIALEAGGNQILVVSGSQVGIGTTTPSALLTLNSVQPKLKFTEGNADRAEIFVNDSDNLKIVNNVSNKNIVMEVSDAGTLREGLRLRGNSTGSNNPEVVINEGSTALMDFRVESDNNTHMIYVDGGEDRVGIGAPAPDATLHVHSDSINEGAVIISQADDSGDASQLDLSKARGSGAQPAAVQDSDFVGQIRMIGYDGDSYDNFADIYAQVAGTISTNSHPTKLVIRTTQANSTTPTAAVTIDENQDMTVTGVVLGKMRHMTHHRYNDGSGTGKEYIPWAGTAEQPSPSYITMGVAPYNGRLVKVLVRSSKSGGLGSTIVGMHIGTDGTTTFNSTAEETVNVSMSSANTTGVFNFMNANHFAAGDTIAVSIDPTNAHGNVNVTCVWEYEIT